MKLAPALLLCIATPLFAQPATTSRTPREGDVPARDREPRVHEIAPASATASQTFANIFTVREVSGGGVLVNDAIRRQIVVLDATLAHPVVALDSMSEAAHNYGPIAEPLLHWLGDSSLFLDPASRTLLVLDANGKVVRAMAPPIQRDMQRLWENQSALDPHGNLLYRAGGWKIDSTKWSNGLMAQLLRQSDSAAIVRGVFDSRTVDTLARIKQDNSSVTARTTSPTGKQTLNVRLNPLVTIDEWAALSDGTLAFVRGHDYHVDFLLPDGTWKSTEKLPFDWKRLTDRDKQQLIDGTREKIEQVRANAEVTGGKVAGDDAVLVYLRGATSSTTRPTAPTAVSPTGKAAPELSYDFAPLNEIADYYPAVRVGAAKGDMEGNLWILPTTSAQSKHGELVYDVLNAHGAPFYRVRMPAGRSIAGFGRNGAVYLMSKDANGWHLERTRVVGATAAERGVW